MQLLPFPGPARATAEVVGGKAASLVRMAAMGLPVPAGVALPESFFAPWIATIVASDPWQTLAAELEDDSDHGSNDTARWPELCAAAQTLAADLPLDEQQARTLDQLDRHLAVLAEGATSHGCFAVRSSSPEEDLDTASFAGGYTTVLGVRPGEEVRRAIRRCFASCLDARVLLYKRQNGLDVLSPRFAVVVQRQIDSQTAGVAFSLDPATNDYDHAVVDASWGQGEAVVSGQVTPDHFVVDKPSGRIVERRIGAKQTSLWLQPDGGLAEKKQFRVGEPSLDSGSLRQVVALVRRVEELYGVPVDLEWAIDEAGLHLLQARPITAFVPLPAELRTAPGEPRRLYADIALSSGLTINAPISPLGLDWMRTSVRQLGELFLGPLDPWVGHGRHPGLPVADQLWIFAGHRMYQNLSALFWLTSARQMAQASTESDPLMAATLGAIDGRAYRSPRRPPWASWRGLRHLPHLLPRVAKLLARVVSTFAAPERAHRRYLEQVRRFEASLDELDYFLPLEDFVDLYGRRTMQHLFEVTMPALAVGLAAVAASQRLARSLEPAQSEGRVEKLGLGFPGNAVVEMGIALHQLARALPPADMAAREGAGRHDEALWQRIETRQMPASFLAAWDSFLDRFGGRGPLEMDLARPRYVDDPRAALRSVLSMVGPEGESTFDPAAAQARRIAERRAAAAELERRAARAGPGGRLRGWLRARLLRHLHRLVERFAGTRDTPKHHNLLFYRAVRQRVEIEGRHWVEEGRLDQADHIFGLTFDDLAEARRDPLLDLRARRDERLRFLRLLDARVRQFPGIIDSRGRILRPPAPPRDAEDPKALWGTPISAGVARGRVRLLHRPDGPPLAPGEILVAYTTDPGWTPLFANAGAIVLEIGGVLQHGAVVAREYGKPCVAGIDRVLQRLEEGQQVEVDGGAGVVRILPDA